MSKKGYKQTEEHKKKISISHIGIYPSTKTRKKLHLAQLGNKNCLGRKMSEETIKRISIANKKYIGNKHSAWKGGRYINKAGYIYISSPKHPFKTKQGYVLEHRLIMEKYLGRYLKLKEVVHHINENPSDNKIENLQLFINVGHHHYYHYIIHKYLN